MTVGEIKKAFEGIPDDTIVKVCVDTPGGYVCPDGCAIDIRHASEGFDWHMGHFLLVPKYNLKLTDAGFEQWRRSI